MRKLLYITLFFTIFNTTFAISANVSVKITVTKTADLGMPEINEIVSKVNTTELSGAMQANYSLPDKQNLTVHMVFYHQKYIGALELKNENTLTTDQYVQAWKTTHNTGNHILFLFTWNESNNLYEHKKLDVSPAMETNHLFTEVMNFIRANLSGSAETVVEKGTRFLANAIRPVWTADKRQAAENLVELDKYKRFHFNFLHGYWAGYHLVDLKPISTTTSMENMAKAWFIKEGDNGADTLKTQIPIYVKITDFPDNEIILQNPFNSSIVRQILVLLGLVDNTPTTIITIDSKTYKMIEFVNSQMLFSNTLSVAKWSWNTNIVDSYSLSSNAVLRSYQSGDRFQYVKVDSKNLFNDGDVKSPWISAGYRDTYCNVFASDLSRLVLFENIFNESNIAAGTSNYAPWGSHHCANEIFKKITQSSDFVNIATSAIFNEWDYTDAGYVVYYIKTSNPSSCSPSGHIATCFNSNTEEVIHVGSHTIINPVGAWNDNQKVAYLYLGYILKN